MSKKSSAETGAIAKRVQKMVKKLRHDYSIGLKAKSGKTSLEKIAQDQGLSIVTVRKLKLFADNFTREEFGELCALRRKGSGLPLHFGYVIYLLAAQSAAERASTAAMKARRRNGEGKVDEDKAERDGKRARSRFAELVTSKGWTAPQLYAAVIEKFGLKEGHHGRTKVMPQDPHGASMLAISEISKSCERLRELLSPPVNGRLPAAARSALNSKIDAVLLKIGDIRDLLK